MLWAIAAGHAGRANFLHGGLYQNPREIAGDLGRAVRACVLEDWGIESDEWTFVVGAGGRVAARFEAFVAEEELEASLNAVLEKAR